MISRIILPILFIIFIGTTIYIGCRGEPKVIDNKSEQEYGKRSSSLTDYSGCYVMVILKDSLMLKLKKESERYIGERTQVRNLNNGKRQVESKTVFLYPDGDYLKGTALENQDSIHYSQLTYLLHGHNLIEGYGEVKRSGDSVIFKHPENLEFDIANPLVKTNCP